MPNRQRGECLREIDGQDVPQPIAVVVPRQVREGLPRVIGAVGVRDDIDRATHPDDAFIQLNILVAGKLIIWNSERMYQDKQLLLLWRIETTQGC